MSMYFFPTPYKDELLYSVLARYGKYSGNISDIHNADELFGSRNIVASSELPGKIDMLVANLPANSKYSSDYFIYNNTLFPYIASFLPEGRAREVQEIMKDGKPSTIYNKSGFISGSIIHNRTFRFCSECVKEDNAVTGEVYWHREHQITGVFICKRHKVLLQDSEVAMRGSYRQRFIPATPEICVANDSKSYTNDTFNKLFWIAEDVENILNRTFTFQIIENQKFLYMERLIEKKYANLNSMVHQKKLRKAVLEFWGEEVLQLLQSPIHIEQDCLWLNSLVRENAIPSQPIRHLILMRFLEIKINDFLDYQSNTNNMRSHNDLWIEKLKELVGQKLSIREMAKALDSTPKTVKKHIEKLEIEPFWIDNGGRNHMYTAYKDTKEFKDRKRKARKEWLKLQLENPNLSRNKMRKIDETLYTRLMNYDKEWLDNHSPKIRNYKPTCWEQKDTELLIKVKEVVKDMLCGKPERISWTTIGGKLGIGGWFVKRKDKMPKVKAYLEGKVETLQEFQTRKLEWAIEELVKEGVSITKWNLLEKAGVKERYLIEISEDTNRLLVEKGYDIYL